MTLAELKAMIEAEVLRRHAACDGFTLDAVKSFLGQGLGSSSMLGATPAPPPEPLNYAYFADLHGSALVTSCYSLLLGRSADQGGMEHFMKLLASGEDKAMVVGSVAYSAEGRQRKSRVEGLLPRFLIGAAKRVPVAGSLIAWVLALATVHVRARDAKAFEEIIHQRLDAITVYVAHSSDQVAMRIDSLRTVMESRE